VRDEKSAQLLESWGIKSELVCDPFFALKIPCVQKTGTVGVQLRSFKGVDEEFLHRLAGAILRSFPDRKFEIYSLENRIDLEVCKKFSTLLPDSKVIPFVSVDETTEKIAHLEYMIAMRFHAILACIRTDVKTLAINYDIKVEKIAREYDLPLIEITDTELDEKFALLHDQQPRTLTEKLNWDVFKMCF
jgi:polysaccharide pyruvyl transferase WcaK-like protein